MKWYVTYYTRENTPAITKAFANMNTASAFVERLGRRGIGAEMYPII